MTCKVSLSKTIRETLKHHLASIFAICLLFFFKLITFFLEIQYYATDDFYSSQAGRESVHKDLMEMTLPGYGIMILVVFIAMILAFDFFRYLHSKRQMDFYESLPIRRKDAFFTRIISVCIVFAVPFILCKSLELVLLGVFHFFRMEYLINTLWTIACMMLVFLATMLTGVLAMIMTGHSIVAVLGFGVFSTYAPIILQYIFPSYASQFFETYVSSNRYAYLDYASPISVSAKLVHSAYDKNWVAKGHISDFIAIIILIVLVGLLNYVLFKKRPAEAAGRAMAFTKCNSIIRILLVIPLTLYVGLFLSQVAAVAELVWMIFGFLIGTILLHGIIESIFQFDIRGLWSRKKQMLACFLITMAVALIFWLDLFHYDKYLPKQNELNAIAIDFGEYYDYYETDGVSGESLGDAYQLIKNAISQKDKPKGDSAYWLHVRYFLKNGKEKERSYCIDVDANIELIDKIYATKEYKDDVCELYRDDWSEIAELKLSDGHSEVVLNLTEEEKNLLFETYLAELTPLTYSQKQAAKTVVSLVIFKNSSTYYQDRYFCTVYSEFTQTIALLDKYILNDKDIRHFGSVMKDPLSKYDIKSVEIYFEDAPVVISKSEVIEELKEHIVLYDENRMKTTDYSKYYEVQVELTTSEGISYAYGVIPAEIADNYKE